MCAGPHVRAREQLIPSSGLTKLVKKILSGEERKSRLEKARQAESRKNQQLHLQRRQLLN